MSKSRKQFPADVAKKLLVLEEYFHNRMMNAEALEELVGTYVQSVQLLDSTEPNLRFYFLQKIQFVLSRPEIITVLSGNDASKTRNTINNMRDTLRGTLGPISLVMENPVFAPRPQDGFKKEKMEYNDDQKKLERSLKAQMYMDVQQGMKEQSAEMRAEYTRLQNAEAKVKQMIENQNDAVLKRKLMRKKKRENKSAQKIPLKNADEDEEAKQKSRVEVKEWQEIQRQLNEDVTRFTIRQTLRTQSPYGFPKPIVVEETRESNTIRQDGRQIVVSNSKGGRVTYREDDDD